MSCLLVCVNDLQGNKIPAEFTLTRGAVWIKMKIQALIVVLICFCCSCGSVQKPTGKLTIEAGIVYSLGGPQPVARETFYLLRRDVTKIIREVGIRGADDELFSNFVLVRSLANQEGYKTVIEKFDQQVKQATAYSAVTDFSGKAEFTGLPVGEQFYLFGITQTRGGHCIWNQKVNIKSGITQVIMDQKSAAYSR